MWRAGGAGQKARSRSPFSGHASFLIESPGGVRIVTDYNDADPGAGDPRHRDDEQRPSRRIRPTTIEPGVKFVLRGWDPGGGVANHHLEYRDVRVHNVPTNVRGFGGTRYNGNSIFVFDTRRFVHRPSRPSAPYADRRRISPISARSTSSWCRSTASCTLNQDGHDRGIAADEAEDRHPDACVYRGDPGAVSRARRRARVTRCATRRSRTSACRAPICPSSRKSGVVGAITT